MKTLWMLIKSNPIYKIFSALAIALMLFAILNIVENSSNAPSSTDVEIQLAIDSVKTRMSTQFQQREDSIQRVALQRDELWQKALQKKQRDADKYYNANIKNASKLQKLKTKYAIPCKYWISTDKQPSWVHVSYNENDNKKQILRIK